MHVFTKAVSVLLSVSSALGQSCVDPDERPRPVREETGQRFRFNLVEEDSLCADDSGEPYQYGQFRNIPSSSKIQYHYHYILIKLSSTSHYFHRHIGDCAEECVNGVSGNDLANELRGYNWDCVDETCGW